MRYLVNGTECDLSPTEGVVVTRDSSGLHVSYKAQRSTALVVRRGDTTFISLRGHVYELEKPGRSTPGTQPSVTGEVLASMPGMIVDILAHAGDAVEKGQKVVILEAMKMQQPMLAPHEGTVEVVAVTKGEQVFEGQRLFKIAPRGSEI